MEPAVIVLLSIAAFGVYIYKSAMNKETPMKQTTFEENKELRKKQNDYETILVKLEDEYGSETIPHGMLELDASNYKVRIDGCEVGGITDIRRLVEDAKKLEEKMIPVSKVTTHIKVNKVDNEYQISNGAFTYSVQAATTTEETTNRLAVGMDEMDRYMTTNYLAHLKLIDKPEGIYMAAMAAHKQIEYANEVKGYFQHNEDVKEKFNATGEHDGFIDIECPWDSFYAVNKAIAQHTREYEMLIKRAQAEGYKIEPIKIGETYTKHIAAAKQKTSHPQRTLALRCGIIVNSPLTFTVVKETPIPNNYIISLDDRKQVTATLEVDKTGADFYIKTFMPIDHETYFKENDFYDAMYQDNPDITLEELVELNFWK